MINKDDCNKLKQKDNKTDTMRKVVIDTLRQIKGVETKLKEILDTIK